MAGALSEIPAREGRAIPLGPGQCVRLINTFGTQVVDCWAFSANDPAEFMSMEHSRVALGRVNPRAGDTMRSNRRRPILALKEDSSPGVHDTLIAACDPARYEQLGVQGWHANCAQNLRQALATIGVTPVTVPAPLNLFMNIPIEPGGALSFAPTVGKPGDFVMLRAEQEVIIVLSCCPQDLVPINGEAMIPRSVQYELLS